MPHGKGALVKKWSDGEGKGGQEGRREGERGEEGDRNRK